jgi:thioredoxin:protein disulfide reductase
MLEAIWRCTVPVLAAIASLAAAAQPLDLLEPDKAFQFSARALGQNSLEARFEIADGYYLYRDKIRFTVEPRTTGLVAPTLPGGKLKHDEFFGDVETYRGDLVVKLALKDVAPGQKVIVKAESQGCADLGVCYPPNVQEVTVLLPAGTVVPDTGAPKRKSWFN